MPMNRRGSLRRGCSLLLALALCLSLLPLSAMAAEECRYGQEGCVCTEAECLAECQVCHPAEEETAEIAGEACQHEAGENPVAETAATCAEEGRRVYTCALCGEEVTETIPTAGHTPVTDEAVAAKETETGLTEGAHCAVCGAVLTAQEIVPVLEKREDPEAAALQAFYDAVDALEALNGQEDPDPDAVLAAQEKVTGLYKGLTQVQKDNLNPIYTEMVRGLETPVTMEETGEDEVVYKDVATCEELVALTDEAALAALPDGFVIRLTQDITMTHCARFYNKRLTIDGQNHTLTRGEKFDTLDDGRGWYNPAMIEVGSTKKDENGNIIKTSELTLINITLDDKGLFEGTKFGHAADNKGTASQVIQDGIIATYNGSADIILGDGAVLKNYGGMSAVQLTGGSRLIMKSGSKICDDDKVDHFTGRGANGGYTGPIGAVWSFGGEVIMEEGSFIGGTEDAPMVGRALYLEGGSANIDGTISNITPSDKMHMTTVGVAVYSRQGAGLTSGKHSVISNIVGDEDRLKQSGTIVESSAPNAELNGLIENCKNIRHVLNLSGKATRLNGTIQNCEATYYTKGSWLNQPNGYTVALSDGMFTIGESGLIYKCSSSVSTVYAQVGAVVNHYGTLNENTGGQCGGFHLYMNWSGGFATVNMYSPAKIINCTGSSTYGSAVCSGGAVRGQKSVFNMYGGEITQNKGNAPAVVAKKNGQINIYGGKITDNPGVGVLLGDARNSYEDGHLVMTGGEISNNGGYGISYGAGYRNLVNVQPEIADGVRIFGNNNGAAQISVTNGGANDDNERLHLAANSLTVEKGVDTSFAVVTMDAGYADIDLGNAKSAASQKITELVAEYGKGDETDSPFVAFGKALWFRPTTGTFHFAASRNSDINPNNYLKVGYIPLNADGTPEEDAFLTVLDVENTDPVNVTLPDLEPGQPYALMWVVPNEDIDGFIGLIGPKTVHEELNKDAYTVEYTVIYRPRSTYSSIKKDDEFTVSVALDKNLEVNLDSVQFNGVYHTSYGNTVYYEQAGEPVYDADAHTLTLKFKAVRNGSSLVQPSFTFETTFKGTLFDTDTQELKSTAELTGTTLLGGEPVKLETILPTITTLVPLGHVAVIFDTGDDGSQVETQVLKTGDTATRPDDPTRPGHTFAGWTLKDGDGSEYDFATSVTEDITLVAQWTPIPMSTVTFDANGGVLSGASTVRVPTGSPVSQPISPTRGGYTFTGWTLNGSAYSFTTPVNADITLVAQWSYNGGGGGGGTGGGGGGGGGRGTTTIIDQPVPLAGDLQLNREDHFAYIKGYEDGTVRPNNPLTRAQVATIYYRLLTDTSREIYFQETNDFTDVPADFWACKAISTLSNAGIINGFEDGTFRPNAYITRAQFIAMTARFETVVPGLENVFTDVPETHWARDEIAYAAYQGWLSDRGTFRPQENITRVETMEIINNVLERHVDQEGLIEGYTTFTDVPVTDPRYYTVAEATNTHDYTRRTEGQLMENWSALREDPVWDE